MGFPRRLRICAEPFCVNNYDKFLGAPKTIIFEGPIGAGKSTMMKKLMNEINKTYASNYTYFIYEYIEHMQGKINFDKFMNKKISAKNFQQYILQYWKTQSKTIPWGVNYIIMERGPAAAMAFTKPSDFRNLNEFNEFVLDIEKCCYFYKALNVDLKVIPYNISMDSLILEIRKCPRSTVFFLDISPDECMKHISTRARMNEDKYDLSFIQNNARALWNIYDPLMDYGNPTIRPNNFPLRLFGWKIEKEVDDVDDDTIELEVN